MHDGGRICNLECGLDAGQGFFCGHDWLLQAGGAVQPRRWSACDLRKSSCHRSHDSCYRVITRPSWRAIPGQRLVPHLQESIRAGRPGGPAYPRSRACWPGPRVRRRQARRAGSAHHTDGVSPARGPPVRRAARTQGCAVAQPCTPPDALVRHRRNQVRRGAGLGRAPGRQLGGPDFDPARPAAPTASRLCPVWLPWMRRWQLLQRPMPTLKRLDGAGRLPIFLDRLLRTEPWCSAVRPIPRVSSETWTLRSVPSADVSRSSRSYVGG